MWPNLIAEIGRGDCYIVISARLWSVVLDGSFGWGLMDFFTIRPLEVMRHWLPLGIWFKMVFPLSSNNRSACDFDHLKKTDLYTPTSRKSCFLRSTSIFSLVDWKLIFTRPVLPLTLLFNRNAATTLEESLRHLTKSVAVSSMPSFWFCLRFLAIIVRSGSFSEFEMLFLFVRTAYFCSQSGRTRFSTFCILSMRESIDRDNESIRFWCLPSSRSKSDFIALNMSSVLAINSFLNLSSFFYQKKTEALQSSSFCLKIVRVFVIRLVNLTRHF